jgi:glycosyltransferase involved in cell wall biosynthesis
MPEKKTTIFHITINPIDYERRIINQAESARKAGFQVQVISLGVTGHQPLNEDLSFSVRRLSTPFHKGGMLKFIHFNWKTFWLLLFQGIDIIHCHDLWVMPAAWLLRLLKKSRLIYDAHEYYAGLEIFNRNKHRKKIWMAIEYLSIPAVDLLVTVSEPLANLYRQKYPNLQAVEVIRNLPKSETSKGPAQAVTFPDALHPVVLYQGHFRPGRGLVNLLRAMPLIENVHLVLIGGGELENELRQLVEDHDLRDRVTFLGYLPIKDLIKTSAQADLGIVLFEPTSLNYTYALPNKFFEYLMAGIPVLASNIDTLKSYIDEYQIGMTVDPSDSRAIAEQVRVMLSDSKKLDFWRKNAQKAAKILNWNNESVKMNLLYENIQI